MKTSVASQRDLKKKKIEPSFFSSRKTLKKPCRRTEDKQVVFPQKMFDINIFGQIHTGMLFL